ncbi:MAG: phosphate signaling complex protein PhoU [Gemmatimonadetes bacterium]|nr:phosphate signaling complex protein PhoU [Gemmatimonadota bacterium]
MRHFQEELDKLKASLVGMAGLAEEAVRRAVESLRNRDPVAAAAVVAADNVIDELEVSIDALAIGLLALQQPMARDLRLIAVSMKISSDLERIGDHAVNIADKVTWLSQAPPFGALPEIEEMSRLATDMLSDALNAFVQGNAQLAREVLGRDDAVDDLHKNNFRILLTHMMEDPRTITAGMDLLLISANLERIADMATNIAEDVVYLVEGRTIKHHADEPAVRPDDC